MPSFSALVKHRKNRYKQFAPATPSRVTRADKVAGENIQVPFLLPYPYVPLTLF